MPGGSEVDNSILSIGRAYDDLGRLTRVTSYDDDEATSGHEVNEIVWEYNDWGLVQESWQEHDGTVDAYTPSIAYEYYTDEDATYGYDADQMDLRLEYVVYPNGRKVHYTYGADDSFADYLSRVDAIREDNSGAPDNALAQYYYIGVGTLVRRTSPTTAITDGLVLNFGDAADNYAGFDNLGPNRRYVMGERCRHHYLP